MSPNSAPNRRSFLARSAAIAAVPAVATLAGGALAEPASADTLPDYAPIPPSALGPAVNAQGYFVGRVEKNLYWVTDGAYQAAFLTTRDGVVLFDAPPSIGHNLWAAAQQYLAAVVAYASGPVIKKYLGVLAAADVYTASTTFAILESIRLDLGFGSQVHP